MNKINILIGTLLFSQVAFSRDIAPQELEVFTAQVHHADYVKLPDDVKQKISDEYKKRVQLAGLLADKFKNDPEYNYVSESLTLDLWSKRLASTINPTDQETKTLFESTKDLKVSPSYNLRHIVLKDSSLADEIVSKLEKENKNDRSELFSKYVEKNSLDTVSKTNKGSIGWVDSGKLPLKTAQILKDKNVGDVIKLSENNKIIEILIIDELKPEHSASYDEAKTFLVNVIKKQKIEKMAQELLKQSNTVQPLAPKKSPNPSPNKAAPIKPMAPLK